MLKTLSHSAQHLIEYPPPHRCASRAKARSYMGGKRTFGLSPTAESDPEQTLARETMNDSSAPIHDILDEVPTSRYWTFISCNP
jgi:hypothetical protein